MKKLTLLPLLASIVIPMSILLGILLGSCVGSTESDDKEKPIISDIRMYTSHLYGDTLMVNADSILLNRNPNALEDTLIIGKQMYVSARFSDNEELSSFALSLDSLVSTVQVVPNDRAYVFKKGFYSIFGKKDTTITKYFFGTIPESISIDGDNIPIRPGKYSIRVMCVDAAGNRTDTLKYTRDVQLLRREDVIGLR